MKVTQLLLLLCAGNSSLLRWWFRDQRSSLITDASSLHCSLAAESVAAHRHINASINIAGLQHHHQLIIIFVVVVNLLLSVYNSSSSETAVCATLTVYIDCRAGRRWNWYSRGLLRSLLCHV